MSRATNPLILALDVPDADAALRLASAVGPHVGALKIGLELFTSAGPDLVRRIRETGASVFLDLKYHDIPNTVAKAVAAATRLDIQMLTVHAAGGAEMLRAAESAAQETARSLGRAAPLVLGVTVLTSMDGAELGSVTLESDPARQVERLARLALRPPASVDWSVPSRTRGAPRNPSARLPTDHPGNPADTTPSPATTRSARSARPRHWPTAPIGSSSAGPSTPPPTLPPPQGPFWRSLNDKTAICQNVSPG